MRQQKSSKLFLFIYLAGFIGLFSACSGKQSNRNTEKPQPLSETTVKYAQGFRIEHFDDYTKVTVLNPWENYAEYATYYLYTSEENKADLPDDGYRLRVPIQSVIVQTFAYFEFLNQLDEMQTITGVTDGMRVYSPYVLEGMRSGSIVDLGDPFNPNIEKTLMLNPDAILKSAYAQQDSYSARLDETGIPLIHSLEWLETSPLARAEWIKLIAAFYDKEALADSIFNQIEERYLARKRIAESVKNKKTVMTGDDFQGTWYVPGGKSFNAHLFNDAGLDYYYKNNTESGSIGLDIETILTQFASADVWLGCQSLTYAELAEKDAKYLLLKSVKERKVFNNDARTTPSGGNDYFESAVANPDLLLTDILKAVYPELLPDVSFSYIKPLEEIYE